MAEHFESLRSRKSLLTLLATVIVLFILIPSGYDFGDPALMPIRAEELDFTPDPSGHPLFYLLMYFPAELGGDDWMAILNFVFGVFSAMLLAACALRLRGKDSANWLWGVLSVGMLVSHTLLIKTLSLDIYALQALINAGIFYAVIRAEKTDDASSCRKWFLVFGAMLGLQVANHLWAVFLLPAAVWWGLSLLKRKRISFTWLATAVLASLVAAGPYTIPSFTMMAQDGFGAWYQASLGGDEVGGKFFGYAASEMPKALLLGVAMMIFQFPLLIWLAPNGVKAVGAKHMPIVIFFVLVFIPNAAASIFYKENHAYEVMLTHYQVVFLFAAAALPKALIGLRQRWRWMRPFPAGLTVLLVVPIGMRVIAFGADNSAIVKLQNARDFPLRDESLHFVAGIPRAKGSLYVASLIVHLRERSVILADWSYWAPMHRWDRKSSSGHKFLLDSKSVHHAQFWDSPKLFDGHHYVVSNEPIFLKAAQRRGADLEPMHHEGYFSNEVLLYRIIRAD